MRVKLFAAILAFSAVPMLAAQAQPMPNQVLGNGDNTVVSGRAHVYQGALGTYIMVRRPASNSIAAGFIPFGDEGAFPDPTQLEGHRVAISGVVAMYGMPMITMTSPDQLEVVG
jgi:hypothetical protein